jgi:hypothetical protein
MVPDVKLLGNVMRSITSFSPSVTSSHAPLPTSSRSTPFTGKQLRSAPLTTPDEHTDSRLPRSERCCSQFAAVMYCVVSSGLICEQASFPWEVLVAVVVCVVVAVLLCVEVAVLLCVEVAVDDAVDCDVAVDV